MELPDDLCGWIKKTPSYQCASLMDEVVKQLRENFGLTFFHFARRMPNGEYFELTTNRTWGFKYVTKYLVVDTFPTATHLKNDIWVWGDGVTNKKEMEMHQERTEMYEIPTGVSFIDEINNRDSFSYSSNLISNDPLRINSIIELHDEKLKQFEMEFITRIEPLTRSLAAKNNNGNIGGSIRTELTQKEIDILSLLRTGFKACEISKLLNVTQGTLQNKMILIREKLHCRTREQMIAVAIKRGII